MTAWWRCVQFSIAGRILLLEDYEEKFTSLREAEGKPLLFFSPRFSRCALCEEGMGIR